MTPEQLLKRYPIISDQIEPDELAVVLRECDRTLKAEGDVVELGCFVGTTSLFLQRLLQANHPQKRLHVYDSFAGLPPKTNEDASPAGEQFKAGELHASKQQLIRHFKQAGLPLPVITKGWFSDLAPAAMPKRICFAFLDGDYYHSITDSLQLVWPHLAVGAIVVVDDYQNEALPGARRAVEAWLKHHPASLRVEASLAILTPKWGQ